MLWKCDIEMKSALIFSVFVFQTREYTRFNCDPRNWARFNLTCRRNRPSAIRQRAKTVQKYFSSVSRRLPNQKSYQETVFYFNFPLSTIESPDWHRIKNFYYLWFWEIFNNLTLDRFKYKAMWPLANNVFPTFDRCLHADETGWQCCSLLLI